ncbi:MAG: 2-amino-4-hydroxy-6-hydroxymethyldihydropteridine pyrophosphokinase [Thiotrichales bacterium SG8_50]|nr:MAG: 2-amino-4-hydroxy-6-hydroxymethyldihydropteridine pyrophosphokinase [Thiotrichales bacterium SG8_50]
MARVYVSIGSNIDPHQHIRGAVATLRTRFGQLALSPVYESEAVGFHGANFLNLVVAFDSDQAPQRIVDELHDIEDQHGRRRDGPQFSSRTLDLDLLLYDDLVLSDGGLELPRAEITSNAFVLRPLADLAPGLPHPQLGHSMAQLWDGFDQASQSLWPIAFDWTNAAT